MVFNVPPGISDNNQIVARPQRIARDALVPQLAGSTPFHGPSNQLSIVVLGVNLKERVRIPERELN
jgi:hypothetical protein